MSAFRVLRLLLWPAGVGLGIAAEWVAFGWNDPVHWIPDLAVGWTFIGFGLVAAARWPDNASGRLMVAAGFTWFIGNFAAVDNEVAAWVAASATFVHRGPLVHLLLAYPTGRLRGRVERVAVGVGYVAAFITPIWRNDVVTIGLATLLVAVMSRGYLRSVGRTRRARLLALGAAAGLGVVLAAGAVARLVTGTAAGGAALLAYEVILVAVGAGLFLGLLMAPWERTDVADLVVELGEARSGTLRGELSRALGDPSLEVGYWVADAGAFVNAEGRALDLPRADTGRSVTVVRREEEPVAAIVHDRTVLADPALVEAVSSAAWLGASNARLQAELQRRVDDVAESRRRILEASDEERARLERRLEEGTERRLRDLAYELDRGMATASGDATRQRIDRAREQLGRALDEIHAIALGLHPRVLSERGLDAAVAVLAETLGTPMTVEVTAGRMPAQIEAAAYFVCSEALVNIEKHAGASRVRVSVSRDRHVVRVVVEDDGMGGADPDRGSGLRGLADRVETLGGTFEVKSARGQGTRLTAEIPLDGEAR